MDLKYIDSFNFFIIHQGGTNMGATVTMILVGIAGWVIGLFGWAQIIGSIQHAAERGATKTFITIVLWIVILAVFAGLFWKVFLTDYITAFLIGYAISLVMILMHGNVD